MGEKLPGVLMYLLVVLWVSGSAEADDCSVNSSCTSDRYSTSCYCDFLGLTSVPQDLPTNITVLYLEWNQITTLSQSDFSRYRSLQTLEIGHNNISTIYSQAFHFLSNLFTLRLAFNQLTLLRADMFTGLVNLQELEINYGQVNDIQAGTFSPTPQLRRLYLDDNKLAILRTDMFTGLGNLQELDLTDDKISDIQAGTFSSTPQLTDLRLEQNRLTILRSEMFTGLRNLQTLNLISNKIHDIQAETFSSTPQLRDLYLGHNNLTILRPDMFTGLGNVNKLSLINNKIHDIQDGTFSPTPHLGDLPLSNNHITMFPFNDLSKLQTVYGLNLDNNKLTTLPSNAYNILSSIPGVSIDNNPWQCDCRMLPFRLRMNESHAFENQINCSQPDNVHGQQLLHIKIHNLFLDCEEPTIRFHEIQNSPLVQGDTLHLVCEASGIPTPDITVILPSGQNATVESDGRVTVDVNGIVTVRNVTAADAGLYVCIAGNLAGSASATLIVHLATVSTTVLIPSVTSHLATSSNSPESSTYPESTSSFSTPFSVVSTPSKQHDSPPTFSLPALLGAIFGSIASTVLFGVIILIWCKRNSKGPGYNVLFNSTNATSDVI
ncbi:uncharacterized protein LOC144861153 [Branchiostoma floridae x Branchiostoma japonicum]